MVSIIFMLVKYQPSHITRDRSAHMLVVQSVPLITTVVSSGPAHSVVYWILHYAINFDSDLGPVGGVCSVLRFPPPIKLTATI